MSGHRRICILSVVLPSILISLAAAAEPLTMADLSDGPTVKFLSPVITTNTPGRSVDIDISIKSARKLVLVVAPGNDRNACDHPTG